MISPKKLQETSDLMHEQYKAGDMSCEEIFGILYGLKLSNEISVDIMLRIYQEIVLDPEEVSRGMKTIMMMGEKGHKNIAKIAYAYSKSEVTKQ